MAIPNNLRIPFIAVEFDSSRAYQGTSIIPYKVLIVGQKTSEGSAPTNQVLKLTKDVPNSYFGRGSDLARMANTFFKNNIMTEVYAYAYNDPVGGNKATCSITVGSGPASVDGEISLLINGTRIAIPVAAGASNTVIASSIKSAIDAEPFLPVTAGVASNVVTLTAKNAGVIGNNLDIRQNYYDGENTPAGITITITAMTGGTGSIDLTNMIEDIGNEWFQGIVCSAIDPTNLNLIETELANRWGPLRMLDGLYFCARRGSGSNKATKLQELSNFGNTRNSKHVSCLNATYIPNDPAEVAAAYMGQIINAAAIDPAQPFHTLELIGILSPAKKERNSLSENNALLFDGISTFDCDINGKVLIQGSITMYQRNSVGGEDIAYLELNTMFTLMYLRYDFRNRIRNKYPRAKLADDGIKVRPGMQVITPKIGKAEAMAIFRSWEYNGLVEGIDQFKRDLICQRSPNDPNRLEWVLAPNLVNQFKIGAVNIQFLLQEVLV